MDKILNDLKEGVETINENKNSLTQVGQAFNELIGKPFHIEVK